jgi:putative pyruvate formate lyase activating enzyme
MATDQEPGYISLLKTGELASRVERVYQLLNGCRVCPRECGPDRIQDKKGFCRTGFLPQLASYGPHFGEEPPLVGSRGSGTIFFANCNLACEFCQNYDISQCGGGKEVSCGTVADAMIDLQQRGCHNINVVSPSHVVPQLIQSIAIAAGKGLQVPIVYNSGGYDSVESLRLLDGIIDIYMPDAKYGNDEIALLLSQAPHYVDSMKAAIREMHRQVGNLEIHNGIAIRGMIIRHLVLPQNLAGSDIVLPWIAREVSKDTYVNIMAQYHWPASILPPERFRDDPRFRSLLRRITPDEYRFAIQCAEKAGLHRGWK